ncbi:thioredoxin [Pusillimonas sp. TS35]|nr:thioredoxin [Pusillimonas sp. TS35]
MTVFNPQHDSPALAARLTDNPEGLVVACYCAAWCGTCNQYRPAFDALAQRWPQHTFVWIDVEELPELLGDEEIENFPTLLIQNQAGNAFFGTLLPHISHLEQLIERYDQDTPPVAQGPAQLASMLPDAAN